MTSKLVQGFWTGWGAKLCLVHWFIGFHHRG